MIFNRRIIDTRAKTITNKYVDVIKKQQLFVYVRGKYN